MPPAAGEAAALWAREWARAFQLQGAEELELGISCLRKNEAALSEEYRRSFYAQSCWHHEESGFRPSFLVPPVAAEAPRSVRL